MVQLAEKFAELDTRPGSQRRCESHVCDKHICDSSYTAARHRPCLQSRGITIHDTPKCSLATTKASDPYPFMAVWRRIFGRLNRLISAERLATFIRQFHSPPSAFVIAARASDT